MARKNEYMQKTVAFGGKKLVLFSLDGSTWSSRKDELKAIMERHEQEKITINDIRGVSDSPEEDKPQAENADDKAQCVIADEEDEEEAAPAKKGKKLKLVTEEEPVLEEDEDYIPLRKARVDKAARVVERTKAPAKSQAAVSKNKSAARGKAPVVLPKKRSSSAPIKKNQSGKARRRVAA